MGSLSAQQWCSDPRGCLSCFKEQQEFVCRPVGWQALVYCQNSRFLSCCMGKTSWGVAWGRKAVLVVGGTLRKSPADQAAWTQSRPSLRLCVPLAPSCPEAGQRQRVAGESDNTLQSLPPSPGQRGSEQSAVQSSCF